MRVILLILSFSFPIYALGPPPVNFEREEFEIHGKKIEVTFKDGKFDLKEKKEEIPFEENIPLHVLLWWAAVGIYSWGLIILLIFFTWKQLFIFTLVGAPILYLLSRPVREYNDKR